MSSEERIREILKNKELGIDGNQILVSVGGDWVDLITFLSESLD